MESERKSKIITSNKDIEALENGDIGSCGDGLYIFASKKKKRFQWRGSLANQSKPVSIGYYDATELPLEKAKIEAEKHAKQMEGVRLAASKIQFDNFVKQRYASIGNTITPCPISDKQFADHLSAIASIKSKGGDELTLLLRLKTYLPMFHKDIQGAALCTLNMRSMDCFQVPISTSCRAPSCWYWMLMNKNKAMPYTFPIAQQIAIFLQKHLQLIDSHYPATGYPPNAAMFPSLHDKTNTQIQTQIRDILQVDSRKILNITDIRQYYKANALAFSNLSAEFISKVFNKKHNHQTEDFVPVLWHWLALNEWWCQKINQICIEYEVKND